MPLTSSPLRYPGGKTQLYKFVKHTIKQNQLVNPIYVEPFAGGAGVAIELLLQEEVDSIVINDFDRSIYSFWYSVLYRTEELVNLILDVDITIEEWRQQKRVYQQPGEFDILELGFATFFLNRTNRSGIIKGGAIGGLEQSGNYKLDCRFNKNNLIHKIRRIAEKRNCISIFNEDAVNFINNILPNFPNDRMFVFLDPPYYKQGKNLYTNFYDHEDHLELSHSIKQIDYCKWINTYDFNDSVYELYSDFPVKTYQLQYSVNKKRKEKEYLIHHPQTFVSSFDKVQFL